MHVLYLHGFASSAASSKARFFAERLAGLGIALHRPDLNGPDFSTITVSQMIAQVEGVLARLGRGPIALIGSSLGAFIAWHVAARAEARRRPIDRLVLLAPALDFGTGPMRELGAEHLDRWRDSGWLEIFHHGYGTPARVHYALYEDARRYDSFAVTVAVPVLIYHGRRDTVVDPAMVARFAESRPAVTLRWLDDDHQLHASLDSIWHGTARFLGIA